MSTPTETDGWIVAAHASIKKSHEISRPTNDDAESDAVAFAITAHAETQLALASAVQELAQALRGTDH